MPHLQAQRCRQSWLGGWSTYAALLVVFLAQCVSCDVFVIDRRIKHFVADFESQLAVFGASLPSHGLKGFLTVGQPLDACSPLEPAPPSELINATAWIVLVERGGGCAFAAKALAAQRAGYSAIIIYNNHSEDVFAMSGEYHVSIPAVMVGYSSGIALRRFVATVSYHRYLLNITQSLAPGVTDYLIPFVGVCVLSLAIFACYLVSQSINRCFTHYRHVRRSRLPIRALRAIPVKKFDPASHTFDTCAICLEDFKLNDEIRVLPCNHAYHAVCIDPWLTRGRRVCPICKRGVLEDEYSSASSDEAVSQHNNVDSDDSRDGGSTEHRPLLSGRQSHRAREGVRRTGYGAADHEQAGGSENSPLSPIPRRFRFWRRLMRSGVTGGSVTDDSVVVRTTAVPSTSRSSRTNSASANVSNTSRSGRADSASVRGDDISVAVHSRRSSRRSASRTDGDRQQQSRSTGRHLSVSADAAGDNSATRPRRYRRQRSRTARPDTAGPPAAPQPPTIQQQTGGDVVIEVSADVSDTTPLIV